MINREALIKQFISNRELQTMEQVDGLYEAIDLFLYQFDYSDLDIFLTGFHDNPGISVANYSLEYTFFDVMIPKNSIKYIESLLTQYSVMLPHANGWFSLLFELLLVGDENVRWLPLKINIEKGVGHADPFLKKFIENRIERLSIESMQNDQQNKTKQIVLDRLRHLQTMLIK
jgi:hypothetical protein